jgi:hypothetical protein
MNRDEVRRARNLAGGVAALALVAACGLARAGGPSCTPTGEDIPASVTGTDEYGLPYFDVRERADGWPSPAAQKAVEAFKASPAWQKRQAAADALREQVPGTRIGEYPIYGTPGFVVCTTRFMSDKSALPPVQAARAFVAQHADLFGVTPADLDRARLSRNYDTSEGLMHHLTFQQTIGGIDVYGCTLIANLTGQGEMMTAGSKMVPHPAAVAPHVLDEYGALAAAARHCGVTITTMPTPREAVGPMRHRHWNNSADFGNGYDIETKMVYFARSRTEIVPAWWVIVPVKGAGNQYETIVDARSGELLFRHNLTVWDTTQPATYHAFPFDSPAPWTPGPTNPGTEPNGPQAPLVARQMITVQPSQVAPYSPNGWIPDGENRTFGNNVDAYSDSANDNTGSDADRAFGTPAPDRVFDFPLDLAQAPATYRNAVITNLFYHANKYHDVLFSLGFNEAAGAYQNVNFSGQGVGGDYVRAEAQDGSGTNNANWSSQGADGSVGRTQMYIFTGSNPDRDGSFDSDVVNHELTHGLSIRLHNGLTGTQSRSMGEGWGDFFGSCLNAEPTDDFNGIYTTGGYITYQFPSGAFTNNYYYGIRRFPYSTSMTRFPYTYADIDPAQYAFTADTAPSPVISSAPGNAGQVHNAGEIWCNTLLEARAAMAIDQGFAANRVIMQLVVDGMKLAPDGTPNYVDERDAIMAADLARYGGANQFRLWQAFAKRGLGEGAASPGGATNVGVVESYTLPQRVDFTFPAGLPSQLSATSATTFPVSGQAFNLTITPGSGTLHYSIDNGPFTSTPMPETSPGNYTATLPASPCFSTVRFYVAVPTNFGQQTGPRNAPAETFSALTYSGTTVFASDDFEADRGWTVANTAVPSTALFTGAWGRMDPEGTLSGSLQMQPEDDHTPAPGTMCFVTDGRAGASAGTYDVDNGYTLLTSPTYDLSTAPLVVVEYWRWFVTNFSGVTGHADPFIVEVSNNNGATWQVADQVSVGAAVVPEWVRSEFFMSNATIPTSSQVKFRFRAEDLGAQQNFVEAAIDDFRVFRYDCNATPPCDPDFNQDGNIDQDDIRYLVGVIAGGPNPTGRDADFNQDGNVDQDDYVALVNVVAGGDCP